MGESKGHFESVILENVSDGNAPEEIKGEAPPRHRSGDQVAGADASHHQDHARPKMLDQSRQVHLGKGG
jgi:hypothetical protein